MGNQPPSSPSFDDQAHQSTSCWAGKDQVCTSLFGDDGANDIVKNDDKIKIQKKLKRREQWQQKKKETQQQKHIDDDDITPSSCCPSAPGMPALSDKLESSSSESSSDEPAGQQQGPIDPYSNDDSFYKRIYRSYTSGSLERDARIDLGTSRGSTGSGAREF